MKKCLCPVLLFLVFLFSMQLSAQQQERSIRFANGNFVTNSNIQNQLFRKETILPALFGDAYFVVVQFDALPVKQVQENLQRAGVQLEGYLPGNAYLATIKKDFDFASAGKFGLTSINTVLPVYKISKQLMNYDPVNNKKK